MLTTPLKVNSDVLKLVNKLPDAQEPVFLDLYAERDAKIADCYENVNRKIARDGGETQFGWCVWYKEGYLIEGEFHAVWRSGEGVLVDITPKLDREAKILFIPDNVTIYKRVPIDNIRVALSDAPNVQAEIAMNENISKLKEKYNDGTGESQIPYVEVEREMRKFGRHVINPRKKKTGRNAACYCGSGKKFKKCCDRK